MSLFEQFPYTNFHELNLDWLIQQVKNYGESVVLSVNGQTGDVVLYQDPNIVFPSVDNTNWTMTRTANGHNIGIQFQNGLAYLLFDGSSERIYTTANPPAYPVTSVDGQTGAVQVFPNADTVLPPVDNTRTIMRRQIKDSLNQDIFTGIQAEADVLKRLSGTNLYTIYDQGNPPPYPVTSVNGSTGAVILAIPFADVSGQEWTASAQSPTNIWELSRYTQNGALATIRLTTANGLTEGYLEFFDEGTQTTVTKKILTTDDIPSSAGVVSLNGQTGVVNLYGSNIDLFSGSQDTVKDAIDYTRSAVAYREDGATASQNIPLGSYVIWQGEPYISTAAISSGDTLSGSNLTAKPAGITNALRTDVNSLSAQIANNVYKKGGGSNPGDVNNTNLIGTYFAQGSACSNLPTSDSRYYMVACFGIFQIACLHTTDGFGQAYIREYMNSQWYPWRSIYNSGGWLVNNTDLDNVVTPGTYGIDSTKTYTHLPSGMTGGILEVIAPSGDSPLYVIQKLMSGGILAIRWRAASSGSSFNPWYKYTGTQA